MAQGDAFTKRARPSIVYMGLLFIGLVYVLFPIVGYFSKGELPKLELPSAFWTVWGDICSVWMIGRPAEKLFDGNKIVGMITGNRVRAGFSPALPTPPGMRVRTGRFNEPTGP